MFKESLYNRIGLQFFAADGAGTDGDAAGSEGGTDSNNGAQGAGSQGSGGANGGTNAAGSKTFSQEQVNTMMANEKRTARTALLKELGYEVKEGAKVADIIATVKGILDQGKTQQQLDQEARQKAEGDLSTEKARANNLQAQIDAMKAGVKADYVEDAIALLSPRVTEEKPLSKLLEESKTKYPNWFGESGGSQGTGGSTNPARKQGTEAGGIGKRLAQATKSTTKSSYFKN